MNPADEKTLKMRANNTKGAPSKAGGWFPALSLTISLGVLLVALAYNAGRFAWWWADPLFWVGLVVIFLPIALRLFSSQPTRKERLALLAILVIALYLVKYLQYPLYFTYFDELNHTRTTLDILLSGHLFQPNPILPISPFYPGLEIVTSAISSLSGLSIFASGVLLIGVVRLVFVLSLYLFYENVSGSSHTAGIATVVYMANPGFLFDDADFAYESLAISLTAFVLFALVLRSRGPASSRKGMTLVVWLGLAAVVITHHLTSYALVAFLLFWTAIFLLIWAVASFRKKHTWKDHLGANPCGAALLDLGLSIAWLIYTGGRAIDYLSQYPVASIREFMQILTGESAPRQLFHNASGLTIPAWEPVISYISVALILLALPFGLFQIWRHHRTNALFLALAGAAVAYPVSLLFHLAPSGSEGAERSSEFVFFGVAFILAIAATTLWLSRPSHWRRSALIAAVIGIIFVGQTVTGNGQVWSRLPGPYLVIADQRSVEPEGIAAAQWAGTYLGHGRRIATDRVNMLLMEAYGNEWIVKAGDAPIPVSSVFTSAQFDPRVQLILQQDQIQFLVVDSRISTALPEIKSDFDIPISGDLLSRPLDPAALAKFANVQNVSRIFDSGDIVIYDVEAIASPSPTTSTSTPHLCLPASSTVASSSYPEIAGRYSGTIYDILRGTTANIVFTGMQQRQGSICGSLGGLPAKNVSDELPSNGPFQGTITTAGQIQFTLTGDKGLMIFSFNGSLLTDGSIAGTYCGQKRATASCSDYGLWSLSPAQSR